MSTLTFNTFLISLKRLKHRLQLKFIITYLMSKIAKHKVKLS